MWTFQFASLQYALVISIDYRCDSGKLIHERTLTFPYDARGEVPVDLLERCAGKEALQAYNEWRH